MSHQKFSTSFSSQPAELLDYLTTAIIVVNAGKKIRYLNQAAEFITGVSASKAYDQNLDQILELSEQDQRALTAAIDHGQSFIKRQASIRDAHDQHKVVDFSVTPFLQGSIAEDQAVALIEIQDIGRHLRISREETLQANQDKSRQLMRGFAHEVKNPLGGILGAAQLLAAELDDPEQHEYTDVIAAESKRLRNLVDRMLGPNRPPNLESINIHRVLERVATLIRMEEGTPIRLDRDYDPSLPDIIGDSEQLIQAVLNIARNAKQALQESNTTNGHILFRSRIQRRFTLGSKQHRLVTRVDIEDNGPGVNPDSVDEIFYPMITGRSQGTGLGLAIAQNIIGAHKGLIECQSESGKTIFSIYIPIADNVAINSGPGLSCGPET